MISKFVWEEDIENFGIGNVVIDCVVQRWRGVFCKYYELGNVWCGGEINCWILMKYLLVTLVFLYVMDIWIVASKFVWKEFCKV